MNNGPRSEFRKHRSLNALLGTPKGAYGRSALPTKSPYEVRNTGNENEWEDSPNIKRRKVEQTWPITPITKEVPLWARTSDARNSSTPKNKSKTPSTKQRSLMVKEIVDITSDTEGAPTSDVTLPSTLPKAPVSRAAIMGKSISKTLVPHLPKLKIPPQREAPSSPPVSATNHMKNTDIEANVDTRKPPEIRPILAPTKTKPTIKSKPLRIAKSQPRSMLLCQKSTTGPAPEPPKQSGRKQPSRDVNLPDREDEIIFVAKPLAKRRRRPNAYENLSDLDDDVPLSKVVLEKTQPATASKDISEPHRSIIENGRSIVLASDRTNRSSSPAFSVMLPRLGRFEPPVNSAITASHHQPTAQWNQPVQTSGLESDSMELMHGLMDQQLLHISNAQALASKPAPPASLSKSKTVGVRPFRRVQSESDAEASKANPRIAGVLPAVDEAESAKPGPPRNPTAPSERPSRQPLKRAMSLVTGTTRKEKATSYGIQAEKAPKKKEERESGPWTVEATDLFDWKPPDWEDRMMKKAMETSSE